MYYIIQESKNAFIGNPDRKKIQDMQGYSHPKERNLKEKLEGKSSELTASQKPMMPPQRRTPSVFHGWFCASHPKILALET